MTTSSFERDRCTRISPSAVLDDRLDGKDLEWARDHLRRCEACRERVEDFREMLLRVGRLPSATVGPGAMDQAFALSIPDQFRSQGAPRSFEMATVQPTAGIPAQYDLPQPVRPEVSSIPDLLTELEREIFRDEPSQDHPMPLSPGPEPIHPTMSAPLDEIDIEPVKPAEPVEPLASLEVERTEEVAEPVSTAPEVPEELPGPLREVPVDSHRQVDFTEWYRDREPVEIQSGVASVDWEREPEPVIEHSRVPVTSNVAFGEEPALHIDQASETAPPAPPRKPDTAMRIAVGLGAAACVLLAAVLYEGGWLSKAPHKFNTTAATATLHPSPTARASVPPSLSPSAPPSASAVPVLFTLGNGVGGGNMFRIRVGTAVAAYTRLVFDMHGTGLPTMVITQPDALHLVVTFKDTNVTSAPVNGISTRRVAAVEPGVQQGPDGIMTIDLARQVQVKATTLNATGGYAWRLVMDLYDAS
jgi:hypothetical protein